jgi:hypothetical protein
LNVIQILIPWALAGKPGICPLPIFCRKEEEKILNINNEDDKYLKKKSSILNTLGLPVKTVLNGLN